MIQKRKRMVNRVSTARQFNVQFPYLATSISARRVRIA
jgi:hypothetical protein